MIATVVSTIALVIIGEIIPKSIAVRKAEPVAFIYSYPLKWTEYLLWPFVVILQWITRGVNSLLGGSGQQPVITEGEFRTLIDIGEAEGEFETAEAVMLENVFQFGDRQVREVMTPRTEMIAVQQGGSLREFLDTYSENSHTRFPVYRESPDNVIGVLSLKDVLRHISQKGLGLDDSVTDAIRDAYFVPETKRISELFDELRTTGNQMALVIDEFGGVAGLVTLKRLLEVVMGLLERKASLQKKSTRPSTSTLSTSKVEWTSRKSTRRSASSFQTVSTKRLRALCLTSWDIFPKKVSSSTSTT